MYTVNWSPLGGRYFGTPLDTQTDFVRNFLGLIGIMDVEIIYAEGLNMGEEQSGRAGRNPPKLSMSDLNSTRQY